MWILYRHIFPDGKSYIGITNMLPNQRWGLYGSNYLAAPKMKNAILRFGWDNIRHEIINSKIPSKKEALCLEKEYIHQYDSINNGYNSVGKTKEKKQRYSITNNELIYQINPIDHTIVALFDSINIAAQTLQTNPINIRNSAQGTQGVCKNFY